MAAKRRIFRRTKNGKEIGQWYLRAKGGRIVPLGTKNATVARDRAALAMRGEWPPSAVAAKNARQAEFVPEIPEPTTPVHCTVEAGSDAQASEVKPGTAPPSPQCAAAEGATSDFPDVAAAAAEAAGVPSEDAIPQDEEARRRAWSEQFRQAFGTVGDLGVSPGAIMSRVQLRALAVIFAARGARQVPPRRLCLSEGDLKVPLQALALGWDEQLRRWGLDLGLVEPWMAIVGGTIGLAVVLGAGLKTEEEAAEASKGVRVDAENGGAGGA